MIASCWWARRRWYRLTMAWRWIKDAEHLSIEEAREQLRDLVRHVRKYGFSGGPITIGEHEPEVVVISRSRHELIMDLLERHGGLEELAEAERSETPTDEDVRRVAEQLGVEAPAARQ
jgi:hypothetical protein